MAGKAHLHRWGKQRKQARTGWAVRPLGKGPTSGICGRRGFWSRELGTCLADTEKELEKEAGLPVRERVALTEN